MTPTKVLKGSTTSLLTLTMVIGLLLMMTSIAFAAHESNNRAELMGSGTSGHAIVNYVAGTEGWSSTARVQGLPAGDYQFAVNLNGNNQTVVCSFMSDGIGATGCSDQDADLGGFNTAVIIDGDGNVVASGTFARRGGMRAG